ncbi:hypothetical protein HD806DRAFT_527888 [Xylariaceae sp. AK1471]|nr:hypothetical protein HD806DRAFT_527888 [Xylariaceae sp. AK1471]
MEAFPPSSFEVIDLEETLWVAIDFEMRNPPGPKGTPAVITEVGLSVLDLSSAMNISEYICLEGLLESIEQHHFVSKESLSWSERPWEKGMVQPFAAGGCKTQIMSESKLFRTLFTTLKDPIDNTEGSVVFLYWDSRLELRELSKHSYLMSLMNDYLHWDIQLSPFFKQAFPHKQRASATECLELLHIPNHFNDFSTQHNAANDTTHTMIKYLCLVMKNFDSPVDLSLVYSAKSQETNLTLGEKYGRQRPGKIIVNRPVAAPMLERGSSLMDEPVADLLPGWAALELSKW